ncbi:transposase [Streptomyces sp. NPDC006514]|uniref:transposase n=1 Tax=Streptomyces sp. NPDC006514 TaxID=3154308 RepID=UPI0033BAC3B4
MTDREWAQVRAAMPVPGWLEGRGGQPERSCHRQTINAIRFLVDNGIKWRAMPVDFPAWHRVYAFFRRWRDKGLVKEFHAGCVGSPRAAAGRSPEPTAGIIDSQSAKAAASVPASSRGSTVGRR